jgi:hypothetical protein
METTKMPICETDLDLLESYLDGELAMTEAEGLWRRLSVESELSAMLDQLRADREIRLAVWGAMEPADRAAAAVNNRITASMRRQNMWAWSRTATNFVAAAAACLMIGIGIGRMDRQGGTSSGGLTSSPGTSLVPVATNMPSNPGNISGIPVEMRDNAGNIVAVPHFASQSEANQFANIMNNTQGQPLQVPSQLFGQPRDFGPTQQPGQSVVPVSDERIQF